MRKTISFILIFLISLSTFVLFTGCKDREESPKYDVNIDLTPIVKPDGLPDYSLEIEWFDQEGSNTSFVKNKPVMILFNGYSEYDRKESFTLPQDIYGVGNTEVISSSISATFNRNISYYWKKLVPQFNVGVFHYENFVDDEFNNINSKIYNSSKCSFKKDGDTFEICNFNLTQAFITAWKKIIDANFLTGGDGMSLMEVRFIGNSVGANLAVSCADYLYAGFEQGQIPSSYVPNRITLLNPWLSNDEDFSTKIDFRNDEVLNSALSYNEKRIKELANNGIVFELIEGDPFFSKSYTKIYDGCTEILFGETVTTVWGQGVDTNLYDSIKSTVAYLNFSETYSTHYTDLYKKYDRAVLDWYLYTAGGSDSSSITTLRGGFKPVYDTWGHPSVTHNSYTESTTNGYSMKYGISAWTPTIYLRAVRGVEYSMKIYQSNPDEITDYVLTKFQSEARQMSNLTMENGFFICGYIYQSDISSEYVDLSIGSGISNYTFSITATPEEDYSPSLQQQVFSVTTERDGFYKCLLSSELYACTLKIEMSSPSPDHTFFPEEDVKTGNIWTLCDVNSVGRQGISATMFGTDASNFFIMIRNCGFKKK